MEANEIIRKERPLMLTVTEACRLLGVSRTTMWTYTKKGLVRAVRIGTRGIRIPRAEIDRFICEGGVV